MNITMENFKTAKYDVFSILMTAGVCVLRVRQGSIIRWRSDGVRWGRSGDRQRKESRSLPYLSGKAAGRIRFCRRKTSLRSAFFQRNIGRILESWDQNREMMCRIRSVWPVWHRRCWEMRLDLKRQSWPLSAKNLCGQNGERRSAGIYARYFI